MKEKYYTPDISELYIGFEGLQVKFNLNRGWSDYFIESVDDLKCYEVNVIESRVPYLNQEDIESLGFDLDSTVKQESFYIKGNIMNDNEYQLIYRDKEGTTEIYSTNNNNNPNSFYGIIKNKSELKKILKQIGL